MRLLVVAAPLAALAIYVGWRALQGRPLSRRALSIVVSLFLLAYLAATAALGLFWVARMELPRFEWHYLFGYTVTVLASVHVLLQLRTLEAEFGQWLPAALVTEDRRHLRRGTMLVVLGSLVVAVIVAVLWVALEPSTPARLTSAPASANRAGGNQAIWIERGGRKIGVVRYLHEESSYTPRGLVARARIRLNEEVPPFKDLPRAPRVTLPPAADRAGTTLGAALLETRSGLAPDRHATKATAGTTIEALATLLQHGYGVTGRAGPLLLRSAASAGALYPTDLYVVARRVAGLEPGLYYFDARGPVLRTLGDERAPDAVAAGVVTRSPTRTAPLTIVLGATFQRTASKYDKRAYRYVALDAGHVATNLELTAAALGWRCVPEPLFDDEHLLAAVGGVPNREGVLLLLACGPAGSIAWEPRRPTPSHRLPTLPAKPDREELTALSHDMTSWRLAPAPIPNEPSREEVVGGTSRNPPAPGVGADIFAVMRARRSFRNFTKIPLELEDLRRILHDTLEVEPLRSERLIEVFVSVHRVRDLEPGLYRYDGSTGALEGKQSGDLSARVRQAGLSQDLLGRAAAVLFVVARDDLLGKIDGPRDYRTSLLEAGMAGERTYLAATAHGIGVCGVGAFIDARVQDLLGPDVPGSTLYLLAIGAR